MLSSKASCKSCWLERGRLHRERQQLNKDFHRLQREFPSVVAQSRELQRQASLRSTPAVPAEVETALDQFQATLDDYGRWLELTQSSEEQSFHSAVSATAKKFIN